jgi:periplasmic copper chaperone A
MKRRIFFALMLVPRIAKAHSSKFADIAIGHSWALPTTTSEAQVMMPLINNGKVTDSLIAASSPVAKLIELRNGDQVETEFVLDPQRPFPMRAVARHLHLIGLNQTLRLGSKFPLTLKFKHAGEIEIQIHIAEKPGE